mmetsp:Transcript_169197/g.543935  ORF Transcript_169197/g.543935 Transcript_169197/m.543935 type:complete len:207 (-) Transcript_169197:143-763(-)
MSCANITSTSVSASCTALKCLAGLLVLEYWPMSNIHHIVEICCCRAACKGNKALLRICLEADLKQSFRIMAPKLSNCTTSQAARKELATSPKSTAYGTSRPASSCAASPWIDCTTAPRASPAARPPRETTKRTASWTSPQGTSGASSNSTARPASASSPTHQRFTGHSEGSARSATSGQYSSASPRGDPAHARKTTHQNSHLLHRR